MQFWLKFESFICIIIMYFLSYTIMYILIPPANSNPLTNLLDC